MVIKAFTKTKKFMRRNILLIFASCFLLALSVRSGAQVIITVAGIGTEGNTGNGGAPDLARIHWPGAIAIDDSGYLYIADAQNNVIRKVSNGIITTVAGSGFEAGTGNGGFGGDGALATATGAKLFNPTGVAVDAAGNIYIADQYNQRIRKVDPTTGNISTFAGNGMQGYGGDGGAAISAMLYHPTRVAVDIAGNVYIADSGNNCIRKVNAGGTITTYAGTGTAGFGGDGGPANIALLNHPVDMAPDIYGNLFIADYGNHDVRMVDMAGNISTIAGISIAGYSGDSAAATTANLYLPSGVAVDDSGNVYVSDLGNARVRWIHPSGMITTYAGSGVEGYNGDGIPTTDAELYFPEGLAVSAGNAGVYITDEGNNRIRYTSRTLGVGTVNNTGAAINVYPNPNEGTLTVKVSSPVQEPATIVITNITGQKIYENATFTNRSLDIKLDAPDGLYFLSATTAHGVVNQKIVVSR